MSHDYISRDLIFWDEINTDSAASNNPQNIRYKGGYDNYQELTRLQPTLANHTTSSEQNKHPEDATVHHLNPSLRVRYHNFSDVTTN